jgi:hypothetical protein
MIMKTSTMTQIRNCRKNTIGFLHISDIAKIHELTGFDANGKSFYEVCDGVLSLYAAKVASNKEASAAFEIIAAENSNFRTEQFRDDGYGNILKYSVEHSGYLFHSKGGKKSLKELIAANGEYID